MKLHPYDRTTARRSLRRWAAGLLCLVMGGCAASPSTTGLSYEVKDSGIHYGAVAARMFWLDDERVMFTGWDGTFWQRGDGTKEFNHRLYVWNVVTGAKEDRGPIGGGLCYDGGFIRYWRWEAEGGVPHSKQQWYAGRIGEEKPTPPAPGLGSSSLYDLTCHTEAELPPLPAWAEGKITERLRPEHGFLAWVWKQDFAEKHYEVRFHRSGDQKGTLMPFRTGEFWYGPEYYPFEKAYLVVKRFRFGRNPWPDNYPAQVLWWLYLDGRTQEIPLPHKYGGLSPDFYLPTRKGVVVRGGKGARDGGLGTAGLYLITGGLHDQPIILAGIEQADVSPDGCKIAYTHDPADTRRRIDRIERITIRVLNLCKGGD